MLNALKSFLARTRKNIFTFAVDDFPGKLENDAIDDIVGPDLGRELGVFIVQEHGDADNRVLVVDTDDEVSPEQILEIFRRHGVSARLLMKKE